MQFRVHFEKLRSLSPPNVYGVRTLNGSNPGEPVRKPIGQPARFPVHIPMQKPPDLWMKN